MNDLRDDLRRAGERAPRSSLDLERLRARRERMVRRKRASAITLSLAITVALIGGVFAVAQDRGGPGASPANGDLGPTGPAGLPGPSVDLSLVAGRYSFRRVATYVTAGAPAMTVETWWSLDDSGRIRTAPNDDTTYGPGQILQDTGPLAYLSTDPVELRMQMIERTSPNGASPEPMDQFSPGPGQSDHLTAGLIRAIGELLDDPNASPELRAALFQVAAGLEGVQFTPDATDPVGRPAFLLTVTTEGALHRWWFDPASEQLLAKRDDYASDGSFTIVIVESAGVTAGSDSTDPNPRFVSPPVHNPSFD
ncbi:MAG: hypothetical protein ACRDH7_00195 [Actinomycetota bacterium]